jgi:glycogen operon protein
LTVFLNGHGITEPGLRGENIVGDSFLLLLNPGHEDALITLPYGPYGQEWQPILDTGDPSTREADAKAIAAGDELMLMARSVAVLRHG